jgi:hypothetical protein
MGLAKATAKLSAALFCKAVLLSAACGAAIQCLAKATAKLSAAPYIS